MKVHEYEGLTAQEAWRTRQPWRLAELVIVDELATIPKGASKADAVELRRFAGYLRQRPKL